MVFILCSKPRTSDLRAPSTTYLRDYKEEPEVPSAGKWCVLEVLPPVREHARPSCKIQGNPKRFWSCHSFRRRQESRMLYTLWSINRGLQPERHRHDGQNRITAVSLQDADWTPKFTDPLAGWCQCFKLLTLSIVYTETDHYHSTA